MLILQTNYKQMYKNELLNHWTTLGPLFHLIDGKQCNSQLFY
jgi:hypothetical protein